MHIQIKYFASLGQRLGRTTDELPAAPDLTVAVIWQKLHPDLPLPANTLVAVNLEYAELDQQVNAGDEVAFFPPVTGG